MHTLIVRADSMGDVLICGPAVRAVSHNSSQVTVLASPQGAAAARLLPGVDQVLQARLPWIDPQPAAIDPRRMTALCEHIARLRADRALILTSFHQSPLPTALLLRLAGIPWVGAISDDYPGALLDLRHRVPELLPEPERALSLAAAAGWHLPADDDRRLRVEYEADVPDGLPPEPYVVLHPGTSVPARAWFPERFVETATLLRASGWSVVVTGAPDERQLTAAVAGSGRAVDLGGRTTLSQLAGVLDRAAAVVVGNTGPAHLAAAVGTPVVSLFAPTVPSVSWAPFGVPRVVLGDQDAPCQGSRATECPVPGHPCLGSVEPEQVITAVSSLARPARLPHREPLQRADRVALASAGGAA